MGQTKKEDLKESESENTGFTRRDFGKLMTRFFTRITSEHTKKSYRLSFESFRTFLFSKSLINQGENYRDSMWYLITCNATDANYLVELFQLHEKKSGILAETVNKKVNNIAEFIRFCHRFDLTYWTVSVKPIRVDNYRESSIEGPSLDKVRHALNYAVSAAKTSYTGHRNYLILRLIFECNLRAVSIAEIYYDDIDFKNRQIKYIKKLRCDKTGRADLSDNCLHALNEYLEERTKFLGRPGMRYRRKNGPLFFDMKGNALKRSAILQMVIDVGKAVGIESDWTLNRLRHASARAAIDLAAVRNIPLVDVKDWAGKKTMKALLAYADQSRPNIKQITNDLSHMI